MINWITPQGLLIKDFEETYQEIDIVIDSDNDILITKISGDLPDGLTLSQKTNNNGELLVNQYVIKGVLPIINQTSEYYFTLLAKDNITGEESQRYFYIIVENKITDWGSDIFEYNFTETIYSKYQLSLINPHNDEEFVKIGGELPNNLQLTTNGLLYGIVEENSKKEYNFTIGVKRDNKIILEKDFKINVKKLSETKEPIWITDEGKIGDINYLEKSNLFVKGYDPNNLPLTYKLVNENNLPNGLSLNIATGQIIGTLNTAINLNWRFDVILSNGIEKKIRTFILTTNAISDDNKITWITDNNLGSGKIGYDFNFQLQTKSNSNVVYNIINGELPDGLILSNNGYISGIINYQDTREYKFIIQANNGISYIQKEFYINVKKGLGQNAVKSYFYINNENLLEYQEMTELFNQSDSYKNDIGKYQIPSKPEVKLCDCNTFDKMLMRYLLSRLNTPITFNWDKTIKKDYIENNEVKYSVFYKNIKEKYSETLDIKYSKHPYTKTYVDVIIGYTYTGTNQSIEPTSEVIEERQEEKTLYYFIDKNNEKVYVDKHITYYDELTGQKVNPTSNVWKQVNEGKEYIIYNNEKIYFERLDKSRAYIKENNELININENIYIKKENNKLMYYVLRNNEEKIIKYANSTMISNIETNIVLDINIDAYEILKDESKIKYYFDNSETFTEKLSTTKYIRELFNQNIYVDKLYRDRTFYKTGNQELIDIEDLEYREFIVYWDDERKTYYVKHNGEVKTFQIYSYDKKDPVAQYETVYALGYNIYDCGYSDREKISDSYTGGYAKLSMEDIVNTIDANQSYVEMKPVLYRQEYNDTDVDYGYYFIYEKNTFNEQDNILFTLSWNPSMKYILQNGEFFKVSEISNPYIYKPENNTIGYDKTIVLPYVTDDDIIFENNKSYIKFFDMDNEELLEWKNEYFPSLNLFYSKPNTNMVAIYKINDKENLGEYWTNRKHIFYELHFTPIFNNNIDNFTIIFYHHNNENSPNFQLI